MRCHDRSASDRNMSSLDVQNLLEPVTSDAPCGENLEYDAGYAEMERAAIGKAEQQFGDTVIAAEEPDWRQVKALALELFPRSKDLRIAGYLTRSLVRTDGLAGLRDGLEVLQGLVDRYWDSVYPQLDPDDDNDPAIRVNTIAALCDPFSMLRAVREAPIVQSRGMGTFCYRDILIAQGDMPPSPTGAKPEMANIEGAFADCDAEALRATSEAVQRSLAAASAIEATITDNVGSSRAPNLEELTDILKHISRLLKDRLTQRGVFDEAAPSADDTEDDAASNGSPAAADSREARLVAVPQGLTGDVNSREDVIRAIDKICDYYKRYEPSSPVPLFLNRAKRLASKSFLEILRDITPDALAQALAIGGISDGTELSVTNDSDDL